MSSEPTIQQQIARAEPEGRYEESMRLKGRLLGGGPTGTAPSQALAEQIATAESEGRWGDALALKSRLG